ncbi:MAG: teichoic acids export ABC transporter ATP-binding subunit TagH [Bacillota bacterium]
MKPKVKFTNVSKKYSLFKKKSDQLLDVFSLNKKQKDFYALNNVSFEVYEGETIGVVGVNGSGKSTLSNLLAGIVPPTDGDIEVNGDTSLVAISAGLNNSLSGLENIKLKCLMHGLSKDEIKEITPEIIDFADIGDFIYQPIKNYSSGMKSRLGFAISVHINPDVLIVDEALSVGDQTFYEKCIKKFKDFKKDGKTIFFISHSISQINSISDRVIWMNFGKIQEFGDKDTVLSNYKKFINWFNNLSEIDKKEHRSKMLSDQMKATIDSMPVNNNLRRGRVNNFKGKKKKSNRSNIIQICILFLLFLFSGSLLFVNEPSAYFQKFSFNKPDTVQNTGVLDDSSENKEPKIIEKEGIITEKSAVVYADEKLSEKVTELPFSSGIFIKELHEGYFKVQKDNIIGYIKDDLAVISDEQLNPVKLSISEITPVFPEAFLNSYQFSLAHLNMKDTEVKENLYGLSSEEQDKFGNTLLIYNSENMTFRVNDSNVADTIIISQINIEDAIFSDICEMAQLHSSDENLYYILTESYKIVINKSEATLALTSLDSNY